jgi:hypothetical protein
MTWKHYSEPHFEQIKQWATKASQSNQNGKQDSYLTNLLSNLSIDIKIYSQDGQERYVSQDEVDELSKLLPLLLDN